MIYEITQIKTIKLSKISHLIKLPKNKLNQNSRYNGITKTSQSSIQTSKAKSHFKNKELKPRGY